MTSPILALRAAILTVLLSDELLLSDLGGPEIFVVAPAGATPPYITFGEAKAEEWSSVDMTGHRHRIVLDVWSREGGDAEALGISNRLFEIVESASFRPEGHDLVDLSILSQTIATPSSNGITNVQIQIEAFTEVSA